MEGLTALHLTCGSSMDQANIIILLIMIRIILLIMIMISKMIMIRTMPLRMILMIKLSRFRTFWSKASEQRRAKVVES